jgi:hypothetical protein
VHIDHQNGIEAEVVEGLEPGERVVLNPSNRVAANQRIEQRTTR